ncbi:MAG TPA: hypothetical protein VGL59_26730 [Polyangia bacterium]|jgi:hypothetical protein
MRIHPLLAASALLFASVTAFAVTVVVEHRKARARRPPPAPEVEDAPPLPRLVYPTVDSPLPVLAPSALAPVPTDALRVHVIGPHGVRADGLRVSVVRHDDDDSDDDADETMLDEAADDSGVFAAQLTPGAYDIHVFAQGVRDAVRKDVATGADVVEIRLERKPVLLGAIGAALGEPACDDVAVTLTDADDAPIDDVEVTSADCTFVVESPPAAPFFVVATSGAHSERVPVIVPASGDPAVVCLGPPCATAAAAVLVTVADAAGAEVADATVSWTVHGDGPSDFAEGGAFMGQGRFSLPNRHPGETLAIAAQRHDDLVESSTLVATGVTEVLLTLPTRRQENPAPPLARKRHQVSRLTLY